MTNKPQFVGECRRVKLNEICSKGKSSLRQKDVINDGPYSVYGASGVVGTTSDYQNEIPYVAVVKDGAGVGRANACEPMTSVLGTMQALIPNPNVERDYLLYLVRSLRLGGGFSGSTIPHIYFKDYGKIEVLLPSLEAQKRIVSQLGLIEAQIEQAEAQITQLDQLVKSRFVEMFGDPDSNPHGLEVCPLGKVLSVQPSNGMYKPQKDYVSDGSGTPIIRIDSFRNEGPDYSSLKRLNCNESECRRYGINENDIVINRVNSVGCMGKTMLVSHIPEVTVFESNMMRLHSDEALMIPAFLCAQMTSEFSKSYFEANAKRAIGQASINQKDVKGLPVLVPTIGNQKKYLSFVAEVDKSRFVDLGDKGNKCILILEIRKEDLGRTYNFGVEILHCYTDRVGLKRMAEGRKRNNPLQVIASNLLARPDNHTASATNQSVRFNYGAAPDFASTS